MLRLIGRFPFGLVAATLLAAAFVPWSQVFRTTTATGGDIGAHIWFPQALGDTLPALHGWSDDWFAGFPVGLFYFPLPALVALVLSVIMPATVAFKLTVVAGIVALPAACWRLMRALRTPAPVPALAALAASGMLANETYSIWGGNLLSTAAGMFSLQLGFALALFAAADIADVMHGGRHRARAGVLIAAAVLSHLLAGVYVFILVAAVVVVARPLRDWTSRRRVIAPLVAGAALSAVWWLPFLALRSMSFSMNYGPMRELYWLAPVRHTYPSGDGNWWWWAVFAFALIGVVQMVWDRGVRVIAAAAVVSAIAFRFAPETAVWNVRWLPLYYMMAWLLAAFGAGSVLAEIGAALRRDDSAFTAGLSQRTVEAAVRVLWTVAAVTLALPIVAAAGLTGAGRTTGYDWLTWNFSGYEDKPDWGELVGIIDTLSELADDGGCGRAMWEYDSQQDRYGTSMAMMSLPYWTDGCVDSVEGLYFEGSQTTPFHFQTTPWTTFEPSQPIRDFPGVTGFDLDSGVPAMRSLGVRWYVTFHADSASAARAHGGLTEVGSSAPWTVFELPGPHAVTSPATVPRPLQWDIVGYVEAIFDDPTGNFADWDPGVHGLGAGEVLADAGVTVEESRDGTIRFRVERTGIPVFVHQSWFPSWQVDGADRVYRAGANMMMVVPTAEQVELTWHRPGVIDMSYAIGAAGLAALIWLAFADRRRRRTCLSGGARTLDHAGHAGHGDRDERAAVCWLPVTRHPGRVDRAITASRRPT
jgi:hypothetical protein